MGRTSQTWLVATAVPAGIEGSADFFFLSARGRRESRFCAIRCGSWRFNWFHEGIPNVRIDACCFVAPNKLLGIYALMNVMLVAIGVFLPGWVGLWAIFLTSFFMSLMFPTIFALGLKGLGPNTKIGGSLLVMAMIGGAVFTPAMGIISEALHNLAWAYCLPLSSYIFIAYYAFITSRIDVAT